MRTDITDAKIQKRNIAILRLLVDRKWHGYRQIVQLANQRCNVKSNKTVSKTLIWGKSRGILESPQRGVYVMTKEGRRILNAEQKKLERILSYRQKYEHELQMPGKQEDSETFILETASGVPVASGMIYFNGGEPSTMEMSSEEKKKELQYLLRDFTNKLNKIFPSGINNFRVRIEGQRTNSSLNVRDIIMR